MPLNLTVAGYAQLNDKATSLLRSYSYFFTPLMKSGSATRVDISGGSYGTIAPPLGQEIMIVDWEKTVKPLMRIPNATTFDTSSFNIYLNRGNLISAWDIQTSTNNVQVLQNDLTNQLTTALGMPIAVTNNLANTLQLFSYTSNNLRYSFIIVSIPIFFIAWYVGTTVSDVSFATRRREIGLLSTKGFSNGQISRIFLSETLFIGLVGSLIGVVIGYLLAPLIIHLPAADAFNLQKINIWTIVLTVAFGLFMTFISTFWASRKSAKISTAGAIKEYLPPDTRKSIWNKLALVALILGTYKIAVFMSGVNVSQQLSTVMYSGGNYLLTILCGIFIAFDGVLTYLGPVFFLWGLTKVLVQSSAKFQELATRASRFLGEIGKIATKNVRRNPGRTAAIAFLVALILAYSVMVTGELASERDYQVRNIYYSLGADVTAQIANVSQSQDILNYVTANVSGIKSATVEYDLNLQSSIQGQLAYITVKAVDPQAFLQSAYYEPEWFSGTNVNAAFSELSADNETIILDRGFADSLNVTLGQNVALSFTNENGTITKSLRVVGFFGSGQNNQNSGPFKMYGSMYWSYVPRGFYQEISRNLTSASSMVLIKLNDGVNGTVVSNNIMDAGLMVSYTNSFDQQWRTSQTDASTIGTLEVQQLGLVFAVLSASVGVALVSVMSMRERNREATIMSVKGLSYKQLVIMFLTENIAVLIFATVLGIFTGSIIFYGNITSSNAMIQGTLVTHRMIFPANSTLTLLAFVIMIFGATIIPIIIMARKYVTNLERMVRLR